MKYINYLIGVILMIAFYMYMKPTIEGWATSPGTLIQLAASSGYYPYYRYGFGYRYPYYRYRYPYYSYYPMGYYPMRYGKYKYGIY